MIAVGLYKCTCLILCIVMLGGGLLILDTESFLLDPQSESTWMGGKGVIGNPTNNLETFCGRTGGICVRAEIDITFISRHYFC